MTWRNGRTLASIGNTSFTYDGEGQRISKTTGGVTTEYIYEGDKLVMQKQGNTALFFLYDTNGLFGFDHIVNGSNEGTYYYRIDGKGEIIALTNSAGNVVANYIYDAWGFPTGITDASGNTIASSTHIGIINPIRYKGYCYDTETGLYYLSSRYYDPEICRFINADDVFYLGVDNTLISYNLYAYCKNNPVKYVDENGAFAISATVIVTGAISATISAFDMAICASINGQDFWKGFLAGFVGGVAGFGFGHLHPLVGRLAGTMVTSAVNDMLQNNGKIEDINLYAMISDTLLDVAYSMLYIEAVDSLFQNIGNAIIEKTIQSVIGSSIDAGVDITETYLFHAVVNEPKSSTKSCGGVMGRTSAISYLY